jgi:hypothetical protein
MCSIKQPRHFSGGWATELAADVFAAGGLGIGAAAGREGEALCGFTNQGLPPDIKRISLTASVRRTVEGNGGTG